MLLLQKMNYSIHLVRVRWGHFSPAPLSITTLEALGNTPGWRSFHLRGKSWISSKDNICQRSLNSDLTVFIKLGAAVLLFRSLICMYFESVLGWIWESFCFACSAVSFKFVVNNWSKEQRFNQTQQMYCVKSDDCGNVTFWFWFNRSDDIWDRCSWWCESTMINEERNLRAQFGCDSLYCISIFTCMLQFTLTVLAAHSWTIISYIKKKTYITIVCF